MSRLPICNANIFTYTFTCNINITYINTHSFINFRTKLASTHFERPEEESNRSGNNKNF